LNASVPRWVLKRAALWEREKFYFSLPAERPLPSLIVGYHQEAVPVGWTLKRGGVTTADREKEREFFRLLVTRAWTTDFHQYTGPTVWDQARSGTFSCSAWFRLIRSVRFKRVLGKSYLPLSKRGWAEECRYRPSRSVATCWVPAPSEVVPEVEEDRPVLGGEVSRLAAWWPSSYQALLLS